MIEFKTLDEAFRHHSNCPFCGKGMEPNYSKLLVNKDKTTITLQLGDDSVEVDYYGDDIKWYSERNTSSYMLDFFGISIACSDCSKYKYTIRVVANRNRNKITSICLNSEYISIEKGDELFEIKNIYSLKRTEYDRFTKVEVHNETMDMSGWAGRRNGTVSLPLIPFDLDNPEKTLDRIRGLIVFS